MKKHTIDYSTEKKPIEVALALCRGQYQRGIVLGEYRLSGADLKGKARDWSGNYAASRKAILDRLRAQGVPFTVVGGTPTTGPQRLVFAETFPWV